jgi:hypothetical protein
MLNCLEEASPLLVSTEVEGMVAAANVEQH